MTRILLTLAALAAPTVSFAQGSAKPISLDDAVALAKRNSPTMIQSRGTLRTSAAAVTSAKWAFAPTLGVSYGSSKGGGGNYVNGQLINQTSPEYSFSQSLNIGTISLWDGWQKISTLRQNRAQVTAAEASEVLNEFTVVSNVKSQYYSILRALEQEASARLQLKQAQDQLNIAVTKLKAGTATAADTLTATTSVGNAQLSILNAQNSQNFANAQLTRLTGSDFPVTAIVADTTDPRPLALSDAELYTLAEQGPAVRNAAATLTTDKAAEQGARATQWPSVNFGVSYSRNNKDKNYDFGAGQMNYSWGLNLGASYQIWNNYQRESGIIRAKVNTDNADANLRESKLTARQNLTQQLGNLRTAIEQIRIGRIQLAAAEENLRITQQRYQLGVGLLIDLTTAQNNLNTARTNLVGFRFDARNARAQIEGLIGHELQ